MILEPRYRNYWLDLARKDHEAKEKERKQAISQVVAILGNQPKKP
jgi:hypothetical protein